MCYCSYVPSFVEYEFCVLFETFFLFFKADNVGL